MDCSFVNTEHHYEINPTFFLNWWLVQNYMLLFFFGIKIIFVDILLNVTLLVIFYMLNQKVMAWLLTASILNNRKKMHQKNCKTELCKTATHKYCTNVEGFCSPFSFLCWKLVNLLYTCILHLNWNWLSLYTNCQFGKREAEVSTFENCYEEDLPHRKIPMREIYRSVIFRHIYVTWTNISNILFIWGLKMINIDNFITALKSS